MLRTGLGPSHGRWESNGRPPGTPESSCSPPQPALVMLMLLGSPAVPSLQTGGAVCEGGGWGSAGAAAPLGAECWEGPVSEVLGATSATPP